MQQRSVVPIVIAILNVLSVLLAVFAATGSWAAPAEDYAAGGDAYRKGDVRAAVSILRKSADAGHAPSQVLLAGILEEAQHNDEALKYFRLAADQGDAEGFYGVAVMQAQGVGTPRDLKAARASMTRAAGLGHKAATNALALAYMRGGLGLDGPQVGSPEGLPWIEKAAAHDHLPSIERLAAAYRKGELGLAVDAAKAAELDARAKKIQGVQPPKTPKKGKANG